MKRQYLHRHHRKTILVTGITDMLLNANATSGTEIFAVETHELMAAKTPQQLMWGSPGGIFILMLMAGYWHWYVGMATVHRWWSSLILLLLLFGAIGGTLFISTIRGKIAFPRWYAFSVPIISWTFPMLITSQFPAPIGGFIGVTWHWSTIVGFPISTIVLMRQSTETRRVLTGVINA